MNYSYWVNFLSCNVLARRTWWLHDITSIRKLALILHLRLILWLVVEIVSWLIVHNGLIDLYLANNWNSLYWFAHVVFQLNLLFTMFFFTDFPDLKATRAQTTNQNHSPIVYLQLRWRVWVHRILIIAVTAIVKVVAVPIVVDLLVHSWVVSISVVIIWSLVVEKKRCVGSTCVSTILSVGHSVSRWSPVSRICVNIIFVGFCVDFKLIPQVVGFCVLAFTTTAFP